jgi:GxxExxY protein
MDEQTTKNTKFNKALMEGERKPGTILYKDLGYQVQGALRDVYSALGPGFKEQTYERALAKALRARGIPLEVEKEIDIEYGGEVIDQYRLDLVVDGKIVVEVKAVDDLHPRFEAQLLSYLRASGLRLGILVNFGTDRLQIIRKIM